MDLSGKHLVGVGEGETNQNLLYENIQLFIKLLFPEVKT